jgi:hypothetical protein
MFQWGEVLPLPFKCFQVHVFANTLGDYGAIGFVVALF